MFHLCPLMLQFRAVRYFGPPLVKAWLACHPGVTIVARDRGAGYRHAVARACPQAIQVADRWHLMENASAAFLEAVRQSFGAIRQALSTSTVDPDLLTCAQRLRYKGFLRREADNAMIQRAACVGMSIKEIVRRTCHSRQVVRAVLRGGRNDIFRIRESSPEPYLERLGADWVAGCHNGAELFRRLGAIGYKGSARVVAEWRTRRRRAESAETQMPIAPPSARSIAPPDDRGTRPDLPWRRRGGGHNREGGSSACHRARFV